MEIFDYIILFYMIIKGNLSSVKKKDKVIKKAVSN